MWLCQITYSNKQVSSKGETQEAEKQLKCSIFLTTRELDIENSWRFYHFIIFQWEWSKLYVVEVGVQASTVTVEIIIVASQKAEA